VLFFKLINFQQNFFEFVVLAYDHGEPRLKSSTKVIVEISDENDNKPTLQNNRIEIEVPENFPIGNILTKIQAEDLDSGIF